MNIGKYGEKIVSNYLKNKGFNILRTNYHSRYGEIDIICENDSFIVFVEVKSKLYKSHSTLLGRVNNIKQAKIIKTIYDYLSNNPIEQQPRIDVIEVEIFEQFYQLRHIENAFEVGNRFF